jgi:uncharacterized protein YbbK (DUF523 family)
VTAGRIRIGVSSCLLGARVRYDGGDKFHAGVAALAREFALVPLCPEVAIGLGVPRPPIQVARVGGALRVVGVADRGLDVTEALDRVAGDAALAGLDGYVFKSRSPSCGLQVPVFDEAGAVVGDGQGRFAAGVRARFPGLPVAEEAALADPTAVAGFAARVRAHHARRCGTMAAE